MFILFLKHVDFCVQSRPCQLAELRPRKHGGIMSALVDKRTSIPIES